MEPIIRIADNEFTLSLPSNRFDQRDGLEAFRCDAGGSISPHTLEAQLVWDLPFTVHDFLSDCGVL